MTVELNRALFQRFVQLYLVVFGLGLASATYEAFFSPEWKVFDDAFFDLVAEHFGWEDASAAYLIPGGALALVHVVSAIGLLWTKRWARMGFATSVVAWIAFDALFGPPAAYFTGPTYALETLSAVASGAMILVSYARGAGAVWFGDEQSSRE
ncbi:hypothetical protein [Glacieibacterium frigidum]|uniref:Uncharacterized protein n=1 Tax=Glacieibacterium frigidum TaxID=2593303 RepID=A0A552UFF2_9SPHN|nr:hypothetical protein [Glacieibacterium frigidum]TRW16955.1 hypothetical protein FMM06_01735 [Glacieibacterium frigidum]